MRILVVAYGEGLQRILSVLSENSGGVELAAVVTVPLAGQAEVLAAHGIPEGIVHPYYELPECVRDLWYDYVFYGGLEAHEAIRKDLLALGVPREKLVNLLLLSSARLYNVSRLMHYHEAHAGAFSLLATGSSYAHYALDGRKMSLPLLDFTFDSQDIFYGLALARRALEAPGAALRGVLINLAPWSFSYDMSRTQENFLCLGYALLLHETHHFPLSLPAMQQVFRVDFLRSAEGLSLDGIDLYDLNGNKRGMSHAIGVRDFLAMRSRAETWTAEKYYPETEQENEALLIDYIRLCQAHRAQPILYIAPVTEVYRRYYPRQSLDRFYAVLRRVVRQTGAPLLDYFAAPGYGFADFRDADHLNLAGSAKFTPRLDRDVRQILGGA